MRIFLQFALAGVLAISMLAQAPATKPGEAERAARHSFMLVSTRAWALFQAADTIDASLRADGSTLHPATITLRLRIEHTLDEAKTALDKGDLDRANEEIKVAAELVKRFSRRIGGD